MFIIAMPVKGSYRDVNELTSELFKLANNLKKFQKYIYAWLVYGSNRPRVVCFPKHHNLSKHAKKIKVALM